MTDKVYSCKLIDSTLRHYAGAKIQLDTPYYIGEVEVMCMEDSICDLVISNILGAPRGQVSRPRLDSTSGTSNSDQGTDQAQQG